MESVFHKHRWDSDAKHSIALADIRSRLVRAVGVLEELHLADLTAEGVMAGYFGLNLEQLAGRGCTHTQQVSGQVHAMRGGDGVLLFDGVLYPSRNNYPASSIALFERAEKKVKVIDDIDLPDHAGWPRFVADYGSQAEIFPEAIDLVHPLVQDRHDADVAVREPPPIDEMPFVAEEVAIDAEFGRNGSRWRLVGWDAVDGLEQAGDAVGLLRAPTIPGVAIDLVEPPGRRLLDADLDPGHAVRSGCARSHRLPSAACTPIPAQQRRGPTRS